LNNKQIFEQEVLPLFEETRKEWLARARRVAFQIGLQQKEVTINDVRAVIPPPEEVDPRVMGAVFVRQDWILLRRERSNRKRCHNRPIGVFTLKR